ncbi:hypothetical protein SAMN05444161_6879 [Rhizobiales bacterium GAS191]|nr:hypothetical protein SAMN05444161_6879 [Rhizobiales bacterium GAS191]
MAGHLFEKGNPNRFQKGKSGNPHGRKAAPEDVKELARGLSVEALQTLAEVMRDKRQSGAARISAAAVILDRAWGKAPQPVTTQARNIEDYSDAELVAIIEAGLASAGGSNAQPALSAPPKLSTCSRVEVESGNGRTYG